MPVTSGPIEGNDGSPDRLMGDDEQVVHVASGCSYTPVYRDYK